mmetsp:Transcript_24648/g.62865  ORF Transcript_24648/g.62865 Transcript_24648/m.62865 type:complete len:208 (+) Transcript_24648:951-1574(+)
MRNWCQYGRNCTTRPRAASAWISCESPPASAAAPPGSTSKSTSQPMSQGKMPPCRAAPSSVPWLAQCRTPARSSSTDTTCVIWYNARATSAGTVCSGGHTVTARGAGQARDDTGGCAGCGLGAGGHKRPNPRPAASSLVWISCEEIENGRKRRSLARASSRHTGHGPIRACRKGKANPSFRNRPPPSKWYLRSVGTGMSTCTSFLSG